MAMSGMEKMNNQLRRESRRRENDFAPRENDFPGTAGHGSTPPARPSRPASTPSARPTRQLEFNQAMADFKYMFPTMEEEVIEAVLRANNGIVDATIDQLLTMSIDSEEAMCLQLAHFQVDRSLEDKPRSPREKRHSQTTKKRSPSRNEEKKASPLSHTSPSRREVQPVEESPPSYSEVIQSPQMMAAAASFFPPTTPSSRKPPTPNFLDMAPGELAMSSTEAKTPASFWDEVANRSRPRRHVSAGISMKKTRYHHWNPPLLGNLPEDFLRLTPRPSSVKASSKSSSCSGKKRHPHRSLSTPCQVLTAHDLSSDILTKRLQENERRRSLGGPDMNPETAQYLEDERLALMLQNSEFLQELRDNHVFMETLERDRQSAVTVEATPEPAVPEPWPEPKPAPSLGAEINEGYGTDRQDTLGAFPFSKDAPTVERDEDAELRRKLKHMGKASRRQFAALARRFFSIRRKKFPRQILKEQPAPSMANLLEEEEEEESESSHHAGPAPHSDTSPRALSLLPSYRTVQRPAYQPDMVVNFGGDRSSMV